MRVALHHPHRTTVGITLWFYTELVEVELENLTLKTCSKQTISVYWLLFIIYLVGPNKGAN